MKFTYVVIDTNKGDEIIFHFETEYQVRAGDCVRYSPQENAVGRVVNFIAHVASTPAHIYLYV